MQQQQQHRKQKPLSSWLMKQKNQPSSSSRAILQYCRSVPDDLFVAERLLQNIIVFELLANG